MIVIKIPPDDRDNLGVSFLQHYILMDDKIVSY